MRRGTASDPALENVEKALLCVEKGILVSQEQVQKQGMGGFPGCWMPSSRAPLNHSSVSSWDLAGGGSSSLQHRGQDKPDVSRKILGEFKKRCSSAAFLLFKRMWPVAVPNLGVWHPVHQFQVPIFCCNRQQGGVCQKASNNK